MTDKENAKELFEKGLKALEEGRTPSALSFFEKASNLDPSPICQSYLAFCLAKERGQYKKAIALCSEAIENEPERADIHLNMGRIFLLSGNKAEAIKTLREGLGKSKDKRIITELERLGVRKKPAISFLSRKNPVNKYLGLIADRLRPK